MKIAIYFAAALSLLSAPAARAANWNNIISCENQHMVVDADGFSNQLVIRNSPGVLEYFQQQIGYDKLPVNAKGELVVEVSRGGPGSREEDAASSFVGSLGGTLNVVVSPEGNNAFRAAIWVSQYRGQGKEIANWIFRDCSRQ